MLNTSNPMKHSPYSLHLEHLASEAGLLVLHTDDRMYLSSRKLRLLGTVSRDPGNGQHYLGFSEFIGYKLAVRLYRLSVRARKLATITNNHTPS